MSHCKPASNSLRNLFGRHFLCSLDIKLILFEQWTSCIFSRHLLSSVNISFFNEVHSFSLLDILKFLFTRHYFTSVKIISQWTLSPFSRHLLSSVNISFFNQHSFSLLDIFSLHETLFLLSENHFSVDTFSLQ